MFACIHAPSAESIASRFSPEVESVAPGTVVFEIDALRRLYDGPREIARALAESAGPEARIAIARNAAVAVLVARNLPGVQVLPESGDAAAALAPLDIECLPMPPALL